MLEKRIKEIGKYNNAKNYLKVLTKESIIPDSSTTTNTTKNIDTSKVVLELYNLAELEAFHFNQIDTSLVYITQIITDFPDSELDAKAHYALNYLYNQQGDSLQSLKYQKLLINKYPESEYAESIRSISEIEEYGISSSNKLADAENLYLIDKSQAIKKYKEISGDSNSEFAIRALLFLANEYDYKMFDIDSALVYYNKIVKEFPNSRQAGVAQIRFQQLSRNKSETEKELKNNNGFNTSSDLLIKKELTQAVAPTMKENGQAIPDNTLENEIFNNNEIVE